MVRQEDLYNAAFDLITLDTHKKKEILNGLVKGSKLTGHEARKAMIDQRYQLKKEALSFSKTA